MNATSTTSVNFAPKHLSGIDVIDDAWGGLYRGGSYLVYGRAASGRGLLTLMFARTGAAFSEPTLLVSPDRQKDLMIQAASIGFNLREAHDSGIVRLLRVPPLMNLQHMGDDGVSKALWDLVTLIRRHRPTRLIMNDFMPFVAFRSFDRFRNEFIQFLEQIDSLDTTTLLVMPEPANPQSSRVIEFMASQMTGSIHIELAEDSATTTKRRISLIPHIGHIKRQVVDYWDLEDLIQTSKSHLQKAQPTASQDSILFKPSSEKDAHSQQRDSQFSDFGSDDSDSRRPMTSGQRSQPEPRGPFVPPVIPISGHAPGASAPPNPMPQAPYQAPPQPAAPHSQPQPWSPSAGQPQQPFSTPSGQPPQPWSPTGAPQQPWSPSAGQPQQPNPYYRAPEQDPGARPMDTGRAPFEEYAPVPPIGAPSFAQPSYPQAAPPQAPVVQQGQQPTTPFGGPPYSNPNIQEAGPGQRTGQSATPPWPTAPVQNDFTESTVHYDSPTFGQPSVAADQVFDAEPQMQDESSSIFSELIPEPSAAPGAMNVEMEYTNREAFRVRLQKQFTNRDVLHQPFLLLALRMDRSAQSTARPFDFDFLMDLVGEELRGQDDMLANIDLERLVVYLGDSRPEEAQSFFTRLKDRLRQESPLQADHLLHSVSAIVVPDGRPFQNAVEFLAYALDEA